MINLLEFFIIVPLIGFLISLLIPEKKEDAISITAYLTTNIHFVAALVFLSVWIWKGHPFLDAEEIIIYQTSGYLFSIHFILDKITAVYLLVGSFLVSLVTIYSRHYLHRESGYKRFFNTVLFFFIGYNLVIFAGNFETLFMGWEILGLSSFLLIAFYRERYLPVKNAMKVFSIYRVGDIGLILAMWLSHHLWHENISFIKLYNADLVNEHLQTHSWMGVFISLLILVSASAKSAQLPFSSWLPRAMEGPTPSSAIFYGSLSVHIGVFLMLRTFPFWEHQLSVRILIVTMGVFTSILATGIARVQSSVKSQIAYASIAQIGLIFIEVAAGFENLALVHFAGNAFLRTYQLLVSPSIVSYLIREQFYNFIPRKHTLEDSFPKKIEYTLYMLCLKEWNLDLFMTRYLWSPLKWVGRQLDFLTINKAFYIFSPVYIIGLILLFNKVLVPDSINHVLPVFFALIGLVMVFKTFTERKKTIMAWVLLIVNHYFVALAISFNETMDFDQHFVYLSGLTISGLIGYFALLRLKQLEGDINLNRLHGYAFEHPKIALVFLLACLGATGFPITPSFIGEDLIFVHIHEDQYILAAIISVGFIVDALAIIRIYARVFLGPHVKSVYEMGYRSS